MSTAVPSDFFLPPGGALLVRLAFILVCSPDGADCSRERFDQLSALGFLPPLLLFFFFFFVVTLIPAALKASLSSSFSCCHSDRLACPVRSNWDRLVTGNFSKGKIHYHKTVLKMDHLRTSFFA